LAATFIGRSGPAGTHRAFPEMPEAELLPIRAVSPYRTWPSQSPAAAFLWRGYFPILYAGSLARVLQCSKDAEYFADVGQTLLFLVTVVALVPASFGLLEIEQTRSGFLISSSRRSRGRAVSRKR